MRQLEWFLAAAMLIGGWILSWPEQTFAIQPYTRMSEFAAEETWARICYWLGGLRLLVLAVNGSMPRGSPHIRAAFCVLCGAVWVMLWLGYYRSGFPTFMLAFVTCAAIGEVSNLVRAARDARQEDDGKSVEGGKA